MADQIRWRLLYESGSPLESGDSIRGVRTGADRLEILFGNQTLAKVQLIRADGQFRPIFYRVRSTDVDFGGGLNGHIRTDVVVFGFGRKLEGEAREITLFSLQRDGRITGCAQRHVDLAAIEGMLQ